MTGTALAGWCRADTAVAVGARPPGTLSVADLAGEATRAHLLPLLHAMSPDQGERHARVTVVHYALHAIANVLIAPLVLDDVAVRVEADALGLVCDERGDVHGFWVGDHDVGPDGDPVAETARRAMALVAPVADGVREGAHVPARGLRNVILDSFHGSCEWLARAVPGEAAADLPRRFLEAAGHADHRIGRLLPVRLDDGPAVELRVPRTCCVLKSGAGCHACPTCPQLPDDAARTASALAWLRELDDDGFRSVTGRSRVLR